MKKLFVFASAIFMLMSCGQGNSESGDTVGEVTVLADSMVFSGAFANTIPCADCPGIYTVVEFTEGGNFYEYMNYLDRDAEVSDTGKWTLDDSVITVTFSKENTDPRYYKIMDEEKVRMLDADKNIITGQLEENYFLHKKDTTLLSK